jgi:hypothetical protein
LANKEVNRAMTEPVRDLSPSRDPASLVVGAIAAQVIGGLGMQMLPLVIGGLIAGLSESGRAVRSQSRRPSEALAMVVNRRLSGTACAALADAAA